MALFKHETLQDEFEGSRTAIIFGQLVGGLHMLIGAVTPVAVIFDSLDGSIDPFALWGGLGATAYALTVYFFIFSATDNASINLRNSSRRLGL